MNDSDALVGAQAILGGRRLNITTKRLFAELEVDSLYDASDLRDAQRLIDAMHIGAAIESFRKSALGREKAITLLRLARAVRPHLAARRAGWFRFLLTLGEQKGESTFHLSYVRRLHSGAAQLKTVRERTTKTGQAIKDILVAGAILHRIEHEKKRGVDLTVTAAIDDAIEDQDLLTGEAAALKAWHRFRASCQHNTYRLQQYDGPIEKYRGRWVALAASSPGVLQLPSDKGGRPKT